MIFINNPILYFKILSRTSEEPRCLPLYLADKHLIFGVNLQCWSLESKVVAGGGGDKTICCTPFPLQ